MRASSGVNRGSLLLAVTTVAISIAEHANHNWQSCIAICELSATIEREQQSRLEPWGSSPPDTRSVWSEDPPFPTEDEGLYTLSLILPNHYSQKGYRIYNLHVDNLASQIKTLMAGLSFSPFPRFCHTERLYQQFFRDILILFLLFYNFTVIMKIITNLLKDKSDEWLVRTTDTINSSNPIVDRIMDDDSVEGVIMTNKEGTPILTNVSVTRATNYGRALFRFGQLAQIYIKELNPLDEIILIRVHTKKNEIMLIPDSEFNITVIQHARPRRKLKE